VGLSIFYTTDSFIAALRRFISLRGSPRTICSDNATNFVGAKSELADLKELFLSEKHTASISSASSMETRILGQLAY